MVKVNDYVNYGVHGVCKVEETAFLKFSGDLHKHEYYVLQPVFDQSSKIYLPVESSELTGRMRPILSAQAIDEAILSAKDRAILWQSDFKLRSAQFHDILSKRNEKEILQMLSCLYLRSQESGRGLNAGDAAILKTAEKMIEQEFAFSLQIQTKDVGKYIKNKLGIVQ